MKITTIDQSTDHFSSWNDALRNYRTTRPVDRFPHEPNLGTLQELSQAPPQTLVDRIEVSKRLESYNRSVGNVEGAALARKLIDPSCVVITSGQQPGLMGGAALAVWKIGALSRIAQQLESLSGRPVVPIYWVHSEDHDLTEVNSIDIPSGAEWRTDRLPIADDHRTIDSLKIGLEQFSEATRIVASVCGEVVPQRLMPVANESWSAWSQRCLRSTLPKLAVVEVEPFIVRDLLQPFYRSCFQDYSKLESALIEGAVLSERFGPAQVNPRSAAIMFSISPDGERRRVDSEAIENSVLPSNHTSPWNLSPGALLRPLGLQALFPVVAHVLGPAEIAYFAELRELFERHLMPFPMAIPRPSFTFLRVRDSHTIDEMGIRRPEVIVDPDSWPHKNESSSSHAEFETMASELNRVLDGATRLGADEVSKRAVENFRAKVLDASEKLALTLRRSKDQENQSQESRRHRLREWIRPKNGSQERKLNPWTLLRGLRRSTLDDALDSIDLWDFRARLIFLEREDDEGHTTP